MSITEVSLQMLKCSLCEESLSVFPISLIIDQITKTSKNICGRCPIIDEEDSIITRNTMYETLAEYTLFPCRYKPSGCRERITPARLNKHEKFCNQRPVFCPHTPLGSCPWLGNRLELLEHFYDKHRFLVIEDCVTEVDIVTKQEENFLMRFNNDLYIVRFECDGDDDALKVNLCILGTENSLDRFQYLLSFFHIHGESTDSEVKIVELFDVDQPQRSIATSTSSCIIPISYLKTALNDPVTIRCRIVVTPRQMVSLNETTDEAAGGDNTFNREYGSTFKSHGISNQQINETLQRKLECPVCFSHFKVPVLQCVEGHSLCQSCRPESGNCPECRSDFAETRNFTLEKILEVTVFNCKNDQFGCKYMGVPAELAIHETNCAYCRPCPLMEAVTELDCPWMGSLFDILQHSRTAHSDYVLDLDMIVYFFPELGEVEHQTYLLNRFEQLFTLHFYCDALANCYWRVQWIGAALIGGGGSSTKVKYAYEVSLVKTNSHMITMQHPIEAEFLRRDQIFSDREDDCGFIMIPNSQLRPFSTVDAIEYNIRIIPL